MEVKGGLLVMMCNELICSSIVTLSITAGMYTMSVMEETHCMQEKEGTVQYP